ncbi:MAG: hypothetical protein KC729_04675 [Candidatus Eisenbacteria bacterium]|uniref:Photosynthesis system II assembly factor Ycf48/Hcf136-like domain-containing protein n=1 Tax=Eiseniibacteriota bacterium TaxID=2212470 RepID=A0A956RNQ9_UNCEI|nr:hypothetical protein [Candidatus Eisenbacteria bacterium]
MIRWKSMVLGLAAGLLLTGPAWARPVLLGIAATNLAGVTVGDGTILFSTSTHRNWAPASGIDESLIYNDVIAARDGFFVAVAEDGSAWRSATSAGAAFVRRSGAASAPLYGLTQIGSQLLAVGSGGTIVRASDQTAGSWVDVSSPTSQTLRAVATNGTTSTVAVGDGGTILRGGINGNEWQIVSIGESRDLLAVTADLTTGRFLAAGVGGALWSAAGDGVTWTQIDPGLTIEGALRGATQIGGATVVVGDRGEIYVSSMNFANWVLAQTPTDPETGRYDLYSVAFSGNDVVACGSRRVLLWSSIGLQWDDNAVVPVEEMSWGRVKSRFQDPAR